MYVEERVLQLCSHPLPDYDTCLVSDLQNFSSASDPLGSYRNVGTAMRLHTLCRVGVHQFDTTLLKWCRDAFLQFLDVSLYDDGSTFDYRDHDSLFHHLECLLYSLDIAYLLDTMVFVGPEPLHYHLNVRDVCLVDAVFFLVPFLLGQRVNEVFRFSTHRADRVLHSGMVWTPDQSPFFFHYLRREFRHVHDTLRTLVGA